MHELVRNALEAGFFKHLVPALTLEIFPAAVLERRGSALPNLGKGR
jgi:hypothetical protein